MESEELVFTRDPKTLSVTAAGYNIQSKLMKSKNPALIAFAKGTKMTAAIPTGLAMIQQAGRNILQNADVSKVVPNDVYDQLLKNMSDHTADTDTDTHTQKKSRKNKKSRKLKTSKKAKNKSKKNKKNKRY